MISVLSRYTPSAGSSVGRKRVYPLSEEQQAKKRPKETKVEAPAERAHYHTHRINSFGQMCHRHADFINSSAVVDEYLLAIASLYMKRAGLNSLGYTKDRYFFYALYLAIETEEDLPRGAEEIILYLLGPAPKYESDHFLLVPSEQSKEWSRRLSRFLAGKDKFWARLDYRTWIPEEKCRREMGRFPKHDELICRKREEGAVLEW